MDFDLANKIENLRSQTREEALSEQVMTFTSPKSGEVFDDKGMVKPEVLATVEMDLLHEPVLAQALEYN